MEIKMFTYLFDSVFNDNAEQRRRAVKCASW